jgi:ATP-dependent Clp protease adaptor protein ClpS
VHTRFRQLSVRLAVSFLRGIGMTYALEIMNSRPIFISSKRPQNMAINLPRTSPNEGSVLEAERVSTKPPPMYRVLLLNDDYTPMDFVVGVLQQVFMLTREQATQVMLQVHRTGVGTCGVFTKEVADTKVLQVQELAASHQHPLQCTMEPN